MTPEEYSRYLAQRRSALAEFPDTISNEPAFQAEGQKVEARLKLIHDAFRQACGNPADGRWTHLAHLTRLDATRGGGKWLDTKLDRDVLPHDNGHSSKRRTEVDRNDSEKRRNEDDFLRDKVESWKQAVTRDLVDGAAGITEGPAALRKTPTSRQTRGSKGPSLLGFKVAKRATLTNVAKSSDLGRSSSPTRPMVHGSNHDPDPSFLPPSFPSHLVTSTPQRLSRRKPPPIPHISVSSPVISSENAQMYGSTLATAGSRATESSAHTTRSTPVRGPTLDELRVASRTRRGRPPRFDIKLMTEDLGSGSPHLNGRSPNRSRDQFTSAKNDALHKDIRMDATLKPQTFSAGLLDDNGEVDFNPLITSTQKAAIVGHPTSTTDQDSHWCGYNSQFDVDRRAVEVAKLVENDVDIEGWCRKL